MRMLRLPFVLGVWALAAAAQITDPYGVVLIDQQHAQTGGIGPGDASGFPITITQPGSYKLISNLTVLSASIGIQIKASNVTLDLNGFTLLGPGAGRPDGISAEAPNVTIRNGVVQGFWNGIMAFGNANLIDIQAVGNASSGVYALDAAGKGNVITRVQANGNAIGIFAANATISDCTASGNTGPGFQIARSTLYHNLATQNGAGIFSVGGSFFQNTIANNSTSGLEIAGSSKTLYGSNTITGNGTDIVGSGISQGNNACSAGPC